MLECGGIVRSKADGVAMRRSLLEALISLRQQSSPEDIAQLLEVVAGLPVSTSPFALGNRTDQVASKRDLAY